MRATSRSAWAERIDRVAIRERPSLKRLLTAIRRRERRGAPTSILEARLEAAVDAAEARLARRRASVPQLAYPSELPISTHRAAILESLETRRALVVCGDTGSGKTTQLPKFCLEAGRGVAGMIGITQPRRIAARAVAARLAAETGLELGRGVGLKIRFTDESGPETLIKVMTDGVLLNEIRRDRLLRAYDTLIIDEAHERSLNIDFLLGYLKRIARERPDLTVIVTSATIDPERFAAHLGGAPILEVAGRHFPIEVRYEPLARNETLPAAVARAVVGLAAAAPAPGPVRDLLAFLPGERWIRESAAALRHAGLDSHEVLPLYGRLGAREQDRIFVPGPRPRVVLATNVAETSLTVPRIGAVIDSGLARISRYSPRHRLQGLGVEPISQASALQRAGRAGRLGPGICVRLYTEEDFGARPEHTDPEIRRTHLAGVILRLEALGLGHVEDFPFLDAPPTAAVRDAYRLLRSLGALDSEDRLTEDGARMAVLPLDPRLARLVIAAAARGALAEGLVLAAALGVADPREVGSEPQASTVPVDKRSDFSSYLLLWQAYRERKRGPRRGLARWCARERLSLTRLREWEDVERQLAELCKEFGWRRNTAPASYKVVHQAIIAGFVDQIAERDESRRYRGPYETRSELAPGSVVGANAPRWVVAAERVATERVYLRTVGRIDPRWIIDAAPHLVRREYIDPAWDPSRGRVLAREVVRFGALTLSAERRIDYARIAPAEARRLFIEALVEDRLGIDRPWVERNRARRAEVLDWEARLRTRELSVGERVWFGHFEARLPASVHDRASLAEWSRRHDENELAIALEEITTRDLATLPADEYPIALELAGQPLELVYRYKPGHADDGITVRVPQVLLGAVRAAEIDWLVPGWRAEKIVALLKTLPKAERRRYVPLPDTAQQLLARLAGRVGRQSMVGAMCEALGAQGRPAPEPDAFARTELPTHLQMRVEVLGEAGQVIAAGRDLERLKGELGVSPQLSVEGATAERWLRRGLAEWNVPDLPTEVEIAQAGQRLKLYPLLGEHDRRVDLELAPPGPDAEVRHRVGTRRLLLKALDQQYALILRRVREDRELVLAFHGIGDAETLADDIATAAADESFDLGTPLRSREAFERCLAQGRATLVERAEALIELARTVLMSQRALAAGLAGAEALGAARDVRAQLDRLVFAGFLTRTPPEWRRELPRFIAAAARRWEKVQAGHPKDGDFERRVKEAERRLDVWRSQRSDEAPWPEAITRYRWMLEEFRVSLFAQSLGTRHRVSEKRLEALWREAVARD